MAAVSVDPNTRREPNIAVETKNPLPPLPPAPIEPPMGFKIWKEKRVLQARSALDSVKKPAAPEVGPQSERQLDIQAERLRQLEFNLEIALGLTIHDYFALYLKNKTKEEMSEAVKQLTPGELSELLAAYREVLSGGPFVDKEKQKKLDQSL